MNDTDQAITMMLQDNAALIGKCERLAEENERLRELVRDIMPIVCDGCYGRLCERPKVEHPFVTCSFDDRMRELGVTDHD